ncbi:MAG: histidine kinase [Candidatus Eisenbacteria bacterium]|nr:histidine kinase [Candidatus Eisenbacteria bacterium]
MSRTARSTRVALAAASFLALLEIFRSGMNHIIEGNHSTLFELVHWVIPLWATIVIASPWCAWMALRFPVRAKGMPLALLAHVGGAAVFVALHMGLLSALHHVDALSQRGLRGAGTAHRFVFYVGMEMSVYAAIVVVVLLLEARREAAERALLAERLERAATGARLETLQAQLQPHFLFNMLNTLAVLARRGDGAAVDGAIGDLGELLRASFRDPGRHEAPLAEELELAQRYLALQELRFPGRLRVEWSIAPDARRAFVPVLLLQPLLENAIEHGLATTRGGRVVVRAGRAGDQLELEVSDDGPGFGSGAGERLGGVGLAHSRERLALLHGTRAALECRDAPEAGGSVLVRLPWRAAEERA